ncbi:hypothetical protein GII33_06270 [Gordonia pseudamarae]|jgi:hypothetical protein|uniref:Uncharacterized protein n=1 Tax=Gordonia pseudamarae TaxID=2831662 RepID=A0ABX6IFD9_9ACTN|nr:MULTISPECIES: hypothetical protein [Gordonia]MBD0020538.1 hypothetical protein [Gordonia sp. (in: high G+C Gram-positive bacteria)]QHN25627.1 hypothetical protein GII33_06270 [Gordonia pseudamarae]QHN34560.1 hypothetical protein GII31_06250 [Gordonia pseudamarae]
MSARVKRREICGSVGYIAVDARLHGVTSAIVSATLSVAAHGLVSGTLPGTGPLALVALLSSGAGLFAAAAHRTSEMRRLCGTLSQRWPATLTILVTAQTLGHVVSSLSSSGAGHSHVVPSPAMLMSHVVALVAATLVVVGAERCYRSITSRIAGLVQPVTIPEPGRTPVCRQPHVLPVLVWAARISERGPPLFA